VPESSRKGAPQDRYYTGVFSHPCFGHNDIPIEVTLYSSSQGGQWKCMNQVEEVAVQRDGKNILIADMLGATAFDGKEVVGGMLIGTVVQNGEHGGKFRLQPCTKPPVGTAVVMRTCVQKQQLHIPVITEVTRWRAIGVPAKVSLQSKSEVGWRMSYEAP